MKAYRFGIALSALIWLCGIASAEEKSLTLEDIIFDAKYIGQYLGSKTLLQLKDDAAPVLTAISKTDLAKKTTFVQLPPQAKPAKPKYETPPYIPESRKWQEVDAHASFLIYVSAEGKVESIYCYDHNDRLFALAVAQAITKWRFNAAQYGDTPLPVLYEHKASFRSIINPTLYDSSKNTNNMGSPANTPMPQAAP